MKRRAIDLIVYLIVRTLLAFIQAVRIETCQWIAGHIAFLAHRVLKIRRKIISDNIRFSFPEKSAEEQEKMAVEMWAHLILMVCEIAHAPRKIHETNWRSYVDIPDVEIITRYLLDPRPTVLVSGHFGNFELGGFVTGMLGFPNYTVARILDNPHINRWVNRFRAANGQFILPKEGSGPAIQHVLRKGGALTLLGDQHAGIKGVWVDFLNREASCHKATALFTLSNDAPLVVIYTRRSGRPMHFQIGVTGVMDPAEKHDAMKNAKSLSQWYSNRLEDMVYGAPEQYWWIHRRWKGKQKLTKKQLAAKQAKEASETAHDGKAINAETTTDDRRGAA